MLKLSRNCLPRNYLSGRAQRAPLVSNFHSTLFQGEADGTSPAKPLAGGIAQAKAGSRESPSTSAGLQLEQSHVILAT